MHFTKEETKVQSNGRAGSGMREPGDWYKTVSQKEAKREARKFQKGNLSSPKMQWQARGHGGDT